MRLSFHVDAHFKYTREIKTDGKSIFLHPFFISWDKKLHLINDNNLDSCIFDFIEFVFNSIPISNLLNNLYLYSGPYAAQAL